MFCRGKCDECGLQLEIIMQNVMTQKPEQVKKCVFMHMIDSDIRIENALIRIQAAIENSRNEKANTSSIVAMGFVGMMHAVNEDKTKFQNVLKILSKEGQNGTNTVTYVGAGNTGTGFQFTGF